MKCLYSSAIDVTISLEHHLQVILNHYVRTNVSEKNNRASDASNSCGETDQKLRNRKNVAPSDWPIAIVFPLASYVWALFFDLQRAYCCFNSEIIQEPVFIPPKMEKRQVKLC